MFNTDESSNNYLNAETRLSRDIYGISFCSIFLTLARAQHSYYGKWSTKSGFLVGIRERFFLGPKVVGGWRGEMKQALKYYHATVANIRTGDCIYNRAKRKNLFEWPVNLNIDRINIRASREGC